jgi:hypothetical protein
MTQAPSPRLLLLSGLTLWAAVLSVETLFRSPGVASHSRLPDRLERAGRVYLRRPPAPAVGPLPPDLVVLEAADYLPTPSPSAEQAPIRLRRLALSSSGTGVALPVETIGAALVGPGARGRCVVLDPAGVIRLELPTAAAWQAWIDTQRPGLWAGIAWLSGLRPYRANGCLWESRA